MERVTDRAGATMARLCVRRCTISAYGVLGLSEPSPAPQPEAEQVRSGARVPELPLARPIAGETAA